MREYKAHHCVEIFFSFGPFCRLFTEQMLGSCVTH